VNIILLELPKAFVQIAYIKRLEYFLRGRVFGELKEERVDKVGGLEEVQVPEFH